MSVLHTLLAIDENPDVRSYLADLGLSLHPDIRTRFPTEAEVETAVARMRGWRLGDADQPEQRRFWRDLFRDDLSVTALMFAVRDEGPVLGGARGDVALPLLRELARDVGPLVVLINAAEPVLIAAASAS